jgi:uncharacterized membrane protein YcaP (DUF421 family)
MFFDGWTGLWRVLVVGTLAYAALIFLLRISGKRTLSKMNAFDLIVTVALGSTLANVLLSKEVALVEGVAGFFLLIGLQYGITWASVRFPRVESWVKAEPSLLHFRGRCLREAMRQQRVTEDELRAAVRERGIGSLEEVGAVVLETDGSLTVLKQAEGGEGSALEGVRGLAGEDAGRHSAPRS